MTTPTAKPDSLLVYRPSRGVYAISWKINPIVGETLSNMDCEVQRDTSSSFDSINILSFTKNSSEVTNFQNGNFFKSFSFSERDFFEDVTYHFRVRVNSSSYISEWSEISSIIIPKAPYIDDTALLKGLLPDDNVWCKEGVTVSGKIIESYARKVQDLKREKIQIDKNSNYYKCQDEDLFDVLGILLQVYRDETRPFIEYKRELLEFWESFLKSGTEGAIKKVVKAILGQEPTIEYFKDKYGWIVYDEQNLPYSLPPSSVNDIPDQHFFLRDDNYEELIPHPTPYSNTGKGLGIIIKIYNPFNLPTRKVLIESLIEKMKPINTRIYFQYFKPNGDIIFNTEELEANGDNETHWLTNPDDGLSHYLKIPKSNYDLSNGSYIIMEDQISTDNIDMFDFENISTSTSKEVLSVTVKSYISWSSLIKWGIKFRDGVHNDVAVDGILGTPEEYITPMFMTLYENPITGKKWTVDDINSIKAGAYVWGGGNQGGVLTSLYLSVITSSVTWEQYSPED